MATRGAGGGGPAGEWGEEAGVLRRGKSRCLQVAEALRRRRKGGRSDSMGSGLLLLSLLLQPLLQLPLPQLLLPLLLLSLLLLLPLPLLLPLQLPLLLLLSLLLLLLLQLLLL